MSYFQEQTVERIVGALKDIKTEIGDQKRFIEIKLGKAKNFIEIVDKNRKRRFINVDFIEEIAEIDEERCYIYLGFNCPNAIEQDYFEVNIPYARLVSMIRKGGAE